MPRKTVLVDETVIGKPISNTLLTDAANAVHTFPDVVARVTDTTVKLSSVTHEPAMLALEQQHRAGGGMQSEEARGVHNRPSRSQMLEGYFDAPSESEAEDEERVERPGESTSNSITEPVRQLAEEVPSSSPSTTGHASNPTTSAPQSKSTNGKRPMKPDSEIPAQRVRTMSDFFAPVPPTQPSPMTVDHSCSTVCGRWCIPRPSMCAPCDGGGGGGSSMEPSVVEETTGAPAPSATVEVDMSIYPWAPKKATDAKKQTIYRKRMGKGTKGPIRLFVRMGSEYKLACEGASGVPCSTIPTYPNAAGERNKLCANHARLTGSHIVRTPCSQCPEDAKLQAHYPNAEGEPKKLCAKHARLAGSYVGLNPCSQCPEDAKVSAAYPNAAGELNKLCAKHARLGGSHTIKNPCSQCPEDAKLQACYPNAGGERNKLCANHARLAGSHIAQRPCSHCPEDAKLQASYPNAEGEPNKLCAKHARLAGSYVMQCPCSQCPEDAKLSACYPNAAGELNKLCANHARLDGSHVGLNPCSQCPEDAKLQAHYPNAEGEPKKLCANHARLDGSHIVLRPCSQCPEDAKLTARYPNAEGEPKKLCAKHARLAGSYVMQCPCSQCPEDAKLSANYPNAGGERNKLCAKHAIAAGTLAATQAGTSREASQFFDDVRSKLGHTVQNRVILRAGHLPTGAEKGGLLPNHPHMKPDGFDPPVSGDTHKGTVWQYHGTHFHGYPPDHPDHETYVHNGKWGPDCYHDTVKKMQLYKNAGYRVKYVWSCDYVQTTCKGPRPLAEVIRDF